MARAEHEGTGTGRPLVPSVDLSGAPRVGEGPHEAHGSATTPARVLLRLPADAAYLSVLRTTAATLAVRLDVTVDEVDDVRIAVDEAASMLLQSAGACTGGGDVAALEASFELSPDRLVVEVTGPARTLPERGGVAWAVLDALVGEVLVSPAPGGSRIRLVLELRGAL
ncbi:hypothetical protein [uncultured Pseudokineococcus sp.]|uniref:ATP-binding protein n=1 Tax=uncultured Pseudokineococcus sp. TaxID=1642928 RepID=UPI00260F309C|nr:hypothetical protein [uncultured Pseudokineococcus sp.]